MKCVYPPFYNRIFDHQLQIWISLLHLNIINSSQACHQLHTLKWEMKMQIPAALVSGTNSNQVKSSRGIKCIQTRTTGQRAVELLKRIQGLTRLNIMYLGIYMCSSLVGQNCVPFALLFADVPLWTKLLNNTQSLRFNGPQVFSVNLPFRS